MKRFICVLVASLSAAVLVSSAQGLDPARLSKPATDAWPTYNGDYSGRRFSTLTKITAANVKHLSLAWIYDLPSGGTIKATPIQVGGLL